MHRVVRLPILCFLLLLVAVHLARAECGDVTGDGSVTTQDALRTLRKAVGQPVQMTCEQAVGNYLAYTNFILCNDSDPHARLTWSEHPGLEWQTNVAKKAPYLASDFERIDDLVMGGSLTTNLGACGSVTLDLDAVSSAYLLPAYGGVVVETSYQPSDNVVYFGVAIAPVDTGALQVAGEPFDGISFPLGGVPAPPGLSGTVDWPHPLDAMTDAASAKQEHTEP